MGPLNLIKGIILVLFILLAMNIFAQNGEQLFRANCASCHRIGKGTLVGPDLKGVYDKYEESWLIRFIRSSQSMIQAGDEKAVAIFKKFNQIPMPDNLHLSDDEILAILSYIRTESQTAQVSDSQGGTVDPPQGKALLAQPRSPTDMFTWGVIIAAALTIIITIFILARMVILLSKALREKERLLEEKW